MSLSIANQPSITVPLQGVRIFSGDQLANSVLTGRAASWRAIFFSIISLAFYGLTLD